MNINPIDGATRVLGVSQGYRGLPVRDEIATHGPQMVSSWQPTPAELELIAAGAPILLTLLGTAHPPVMLEVGLPPTAQPARPEDLPPCPFCGAIPIDVTAPCETYPDGWVSCSTIRANGERCGDHAHTLTGWRDRAKALLP